VVGVAVAFGREAEAASTGSDSPLITIGQLLHRSPPREMRPPTPVCGPTRQRQTDTRSPSRTEVSPTSSGDSGSTYENESAGTPAVGLGMDCETLSDAS